MDNSPVKNRLTELLHESRRMYDQFVASLSESDRAAVGTPEQWSAKDNMAHILSWIERQNMRIAAAKDLEEPPNFDDFQSLNERTFADRKDWSRAEVTTRFNHALDMLIANVQEFSETDLTDPQRYPWMQGRAMWRSILGNGYAHPIEHYSNYYVEKGDMARAEQMQQAAVAAWEGFGSDVDRGNGLYNLACFYAKTGQSDKALKLLPDALRLNPGLVEWSKEDTDLVPLHAEPAYQALYTA